MNFNYTQRNTILLSITDAFSSTNNSTMMLRSIFKQTWQRGLFWRIKYATLWPAWSKYCSIVIVMSGTCMSNQVLHHEKHVCFLHVCIYHHFLLQILCIIQTYLARRREKHCFLLQSYLSSSSSMGLANQILWCT